MADPLDNLPSGEQLRRLLLQEEQERLDHLEARLGDDEALKNSLVPLIADVLRDAGVRDYRRLAGAIAPIVLQSIKTEIHNSRDMMVDALYPITGRLVSAAVRNAFKDLVEQLNQKLDQSLSVDRWRARFKAKMTGRSEAEILLSEGAVFEITDLLLINRETGFLIAQAGADAEQGGMDSQMLGSILTAIMAFVRDAMHEASEQDLRSLQVGDMRLHLQVSPAVILAIKTKGPPPSGFESALNEAFCDFLTQWGGTLSSPDDVDSDQEAALARDLDERFQSLLKAKQTNFKAPSKKGAILLGTLAAVAIGLVGWHVYGGWQRDRTEAAAKAVIDGMPQLTGYPFEVRYRDDDDALHVAGLTPDGDSLEKLRAQLEEALPDTDLMLEIRALPERQVDLDHLATRDDVKRSKAVLEESLTATEQNLSAVEESLIVAIDQNADALWTSIRGIEEVLPTKDQREFGAFQGWLGQQALYFNDGSSFDDLGHVDSVLLEVSRRLLALPEDVGLLVVGYADDSGGQETNERISLERAETVSGRLRDLGVPAKRLTSVGRADENRISELEGRGSVNRRVELELSFSRPGGTFGRGTPTVDGGDVER